jgi:competence protein ComGC
LQQIEKNTMMKLITRHHFLLTICALLLVLICYLSVSGPMHFEKQKTEREKVVQARMAMIQQAEEKYLQIHDTYTASFDSLVKEGLLADSLRFIPYSNGKQFSLQTSIEELKSGKMEPQMLCSATYQDYLDGMNEQEIANLIMQASEKGTFPGLTVGNMNP